MNDGPMHDLPGPFEAELSSLRPQRISGDLRRRIAERLAGPVPARRRWCSKSTLAGSLAAACLAIVAWPMIGTRNVETSPEFVRPRQVAVAAADTAAPRLLAYQRALDRSPEELDDLLNRHAGSTSLRDSQPVQVGAFTRSDAALHTLLGDD